MTREEQIAQAEERRITFVAWMAGRNRKLSAIDNTRAYHDMALLCSTPVWDRGDEEIKLFNKCLEHSNKGDS